MRWGVSIKPNHVHNSDREKLGGREQPLHTRLILREYGLAVNVQISRFFVAQFVAAFRCRVVAQVSVCDMDRPLLIQ